MLYFLRFAQAWLLYFLLPLLLLLVWIRLRFFKPTKYSYSCAQILKTHNLATRHPYKKLFFGLRALTLLALVLLIAKPQLVDSRSKIDVEGIDIVLALDVSGSMQFQDYDDDKRSRVDVAKAEAIRFVQKRDNDGIGIVIFGNDAVSRCPLTLDKNMLKKIIEELHIGVIDPDGTMLSKGMVTAINRLKHSKAQSKVLILLTDGEPSEGDMKPATAIEVAQKLGIKVYTVGIGSEKDEFFMHPFYGMVAKPKVNAALLKKIATSTGGQFFMAHNAHDMRVIYDTIDSLEKTQHEAPLFSKYYDIFIPVLLILLGLLLFELWASSFVWFGI